ncbi:ribonuclease D [Salinisphaera sp. USBA-960]|uniref:ribonuclease D n=1 Tax=Salinisphaera orenii TaxID=856731 RepID=UPI000DBE6C5A|nr:ribonuclease D [Salifodinibacter halophilus]NNC26791.1 ribonuclease D [Salifodinibacter halophilus]
MIQNTSQSVAVIDTSADLSAFLEAIGQPTTLALDTEFARERTYFPRLCLIQLAVDNRIALIDALTIDDLDPLAALWANPQVTTVIHSATQDLEVLLHRTGALPACVYDTQMAAAFAGYDAQAGYAALVESELGVTLAKGHTRTDWQQRPLPSGALDYAADDVRYLPALHGRLAEQLADAGRQQWLAEDCARLTDAERYRPHPDKSIRFVRGLDQLEASALPIAAHLAAWRERTAVNADRPRRWILADDAVVEMARRQPSRTADLAVIESLPKRTRERHGNALIDTITAADGDTAMAPAATTKPTPAERRQTKAGMAELRRIAGTLKIAPGALGSRADVEALVSGRRDTRLETGWRAEVAGAAIAAAIGASTAG